MFPKNRRGSTTFEAQISYAIEHLNLTAEQYEIYKHHTTQPNNILNDQLQYKSHTLFDTIIQNKH